MMDLYKITREELDRKLELHKLWLNNDEGGERLDLSNHYLRGFDLTRVDLSYGNLRNTDLSHANLNGVKLEGADLGSAILSVAILRWANLRGANLNGANLYYTNLSHANLHNADLRGANLNGADLRGAELEGADLRGVNKSFMTLFLSCKSLGAKNDTVFVNQLLVHVVDAIKSLEEEERKEYEEVLTTNLPFAQRFRPDDSTLDGLLERKRD